MWCTCAEALCGAVKSVCAVRLRSRVGGAPHNVGMSQQPLLGQRPATPPPGVPAPERMLARFHGHARALFWSALILVATAAAFGWFFNQLPAPFENWMLAAAASAVVLLLVFIPWLVWVGRRYTITTRRVVVREGLFTRRRREVLHTRGYGIDVRRGPIQRMWRAGNITLTNGIEPPLVLRNIPDVVLVQEVLADQIEVSQILAHRDAVSGIMPPPFDPQAFPPAR